MFVRRLGVGLLSSFLVFAAWVTPVSSEPGDKQLARVKGIVGYQSGPTATDFKAIFGRLDLPDNAYAVTKPNGAAVLRLRDSSEIDIGANTVVQVGAFNAVSSGNQNTIALQNGALHFNIRHPEGGQSNYKFVTATSQIAVRGTEGFLIAGASGTQVVCVSCAVGDVSVQVGQQSVSIVSGQTLTVVGTSPATAVTSVTTNTAVNNPAVNQFNNGSNPFSATPTTTTVDPTGSLSGSGTTAAGSGLGTAAAAAGATGATVGTIAATQNKSTPAPETPTPTPPTPTPNPSSTPTAPPTPGPFVINVSYPGANASFPVPFNWPFQQANATSQAQISCSPASVITCTLAQAISGTTLQGAVNGNLVGPGQFTVSGSSNGFTIPTTTFTVYGGVSASSSTLNFTSSTPQQITFTQLPSGTPLSTNVSCAPGASMTVSPPSGPSPLTATVTPVSAPSSPQTSAACLLTVTGQGGTTASSTTVQVNITFTSIGVSSKTRRPL